MTGDVTSYEYSDQIMCFYRTQLPVLLSYSLREAKYQQQLTNHNLVTMYIMNLYLRPSHPPCQGKNKLRNRSAEQNQIE